MRLPSNCVIWALWMWLRHGGYVRFRRTTYHVMGGIKRGFWIHLSWSRDGRHWYSYAPPEPPPRWHRVFLAVGIAPPLYFGHVREEDE